MHFIGNSRGSGSGGGGTSPPPSATVSFSPPSGAYAGTSQNVLISVTGAPKLRWRINSGAWTTVNATSTTVAVPLNVAGNNLFADALNAGGSVLASKSAFYQKPEGGN